MSGLAVRILTAVIRFYQLYLSPYLGKNCRFYPTCSQYAMTAIQTHGAIKGSLMAACRIMRCGPWHPGGVDLVPDTFSFRGLFCVHTRATDSNASKDHSTREGESI